MIVIAAMAPAHLVKLVAHHSAEAFRDKIRKNNYNKYIMKKLLIISLVVFSLIGLCAIFSNYVLAQGGVDLTSISPIKAEATTAGVSALIGNVIKILLGVTGSVAFVMFIYGGMFMLTSRGNPDMIKKGKDILIWAVIGLIVIFGSYVFVSFIITAITGGAGGGGNTSPSTTSQSACSSEAGKSCVPNASANQEHGYFNCGSSTGTCPSGQTCCEY
jgi:hypothetical protein